jgi:UDP-N-acetyl-D-glucosamine dehydrogenase
MTQVKVVIVGQGYVGLPLAMEAVRAGYDVTGYDINGTRVERLMAGDSYVEDVPADALKEALASCRYRATAHAKGCAGFDVAVITVPTPLKDGNPDLSSIETSARTLARYVRPGSTVVLESTTYPGTTEELVVPILEEGSGLVAGEDFHVGYSPERIDPGNKAWTVRTTPKVISGIDAPSLEKVAEFYGRVVDRTVPVSGTREAELTKLLENTFRHVNIALVNELAMFAADLGIDVWEAIDAATTKPFGYMRFTPGPGAGGHCLPIDPSYLSWRVKRRLGHSFRFVELANDVNDHMPEYVVRRLMLGLNQSAKALKGSRVLLLGLSYKKNTGDARESPAKRVAELALSYGAVVRASDPYVRGDEIDPRITTVEVTEEEVAAADAVVLLTDHDCFDYGMIGAHARYVLDTRSRLHGAGVERL